jgi:hypothetical protein
MVGLRAPRATLVALALAASLVGATARAQVIEIEADGSTVTYTGPTQDLDGDIRPLTPPPRQPLRSGWAGPAAPSPATALAIHDAAARHQLSEQLVAAVAWRESRFDPAAVSPKGARGVMQLMPETARRLGVDAGDPVANIDGGADYLARMIRRFDGDLTKALAAYNAGPEAVERYRGVPPYAETNAYVRAVLDRVNRLGGASITSGPGVAGGF